MTAIRDLNPKPGQVLRYTANHEMRGVEIEVPDCNQACAKTYGEASVALIDRHGHLSFMQKGQAYGDVDSWEVVT